MSIVVRFSPTNVTTEKYEETLRPLKGAGAFPPDGMEYNPLRAGREPPCERDLGLSRAAGGVR